MRACNLCLGDDYYRDGETRSVWRLSLNAEDEVVVGYVTVGGAPGEDVLLWYETVQTVQTARQPVKHARVLPAYEPRDAP